MFYITVLIFVDLFFIITGLAITSSGQAGIGSIIINAVLDIDNYTFTSFFLQILGDVYDTVVGGSSGTGLFGLILGTAVTAGLIFISKSDFLVSIPIAITLGIMVTDFLFIYSKLASLNNLLAIMVVAPIILLYSLTALEWARGKD